MENNQNAISCKVVLIGEAGVGSTSIINRYINNTFSTNSMSTTGASFAAKTMYFENHDKYVKFEVWDTAGQEKYRSLIKIFYKDASVAVLVYDITRKQSFEEIKNYWISQLKENAPKNLSKNHYDKFLKINFFLFLVIAFAANKSDMYEMEEVEEEKGRAFAKEAGGIFKYTSAKNSTGIDELFRTIGNRFLDPNFEENMPNATSSYIEQALNERRETIRITKESQKSEKKVGGCCSKS